MAEHERFEREGASERGRNSLVSRVVLVVALIVALLAGLMIFDGKSESSADAASSPVAVALNPRIGVSVSAAPAQAASVPEGLPAEIAQAIKEAPDAAQATLASMSAPATNASPAPVAVPEGTSDVPRKQPEAAVASSSARTLPRAGRDSAGAITKAEPSPPSPVGPQPVAESRDSGPFILQVGVFSNPGNAEDLRKKLRQAGIPSQLETRVQIGPFSSKEEAAKAQARLKKLGLGGGMLVPANAKRP